MHTRSLMLPSDSGCNLCRGRAMVRPAFRSTPPQPCSPPWRHCGGFSGAKADAPSGQWRRVLPLDLLGSPLDHPSDVSLASGKVCFPRLPVLTARLTGHFESAKQSHMPGSQHLPSKNTTFAELLKTAEQAVRLGLNPHLLAFSPEPPPEDLAVKAKTGQTDGQIEGALAMPG